MRKTRILCVNDASFLKTGYGVYGHEILSRLKATGKYDICELGCYADAKDKNISKVGWGFIPNGPTSAAEESEYKSNNSNEFGAWKFEQTCLYFKPDVVITFRDFWMDEFINRSPYRRLFNYITMPTVDSVPQDELWISNYLKADKVLTYTQWGKEVLERQTCGRLKISGIAPPAANPQDYFPVANKSAHKESIGITPDSIILGTVMRNQPRKLYQDLYHSFAEIIKRLPPEIARRTYLYSHLGYPDLSHDIPKLVRDSGVGSHLLFTYSCLNCREVFPSFFRDAKTYCPKCGKFSALLPGARVHIKGKDLGRVLNCFDLYIQYAQNEGFGMPIIEAAYCNVPIIAVNYSAMSSLIEEIGAESVGVIRYGEDHFTKTYRAYPDNAEFVQKVINYLVYPDTSGADRLDELGKKQGGLARKKFNYDASVKEWERIIDDLPHKNAWNSPPKIISVNNLNVPYHLSNSKFVEWCVMNVLQDRDMMEDYMVFIVLKNLNYGCRTNSGIYNGMNNTSPLRTHPIYTKQDCLADFVRIAENNNKWENERWNTLAI